MSLLPIIGLIAVGAVGGTLLHKLKTEKGDNMYNEPKARPVFGHRTTAPTPTTAKQRLERLILVAMGVGTFAGAYAVVAVLRLLGVH